MGNVYISIDRSINCIESHMYIYRFTAGRNKQLGFDTYSKVIDLNTLWQATMIWDLVMVSRRM